MLPGPARRRIAARRVLGGALAASLALGLAACAPDPVSQDYLDGTGAGYIATDGLRYKIFPAGERSEPVVFGGLTDQGGGFTSTDVLGQVVVVNFWYAACGPCRVEAPVLEEVWQRHQGDPVVFIGVNIRDEAETALSFAETFGVTYPSLMDARRGDTKLAFTSIVPVQTPPTTVVLDREGRVAARLIGAITEESILSSIVRDVLAETP